MNELPTLPEHNSASASAAAPQIDPAAAPERISKPPVEPSVTDMLQRPLTVAVIVLFILLAAQAFSTRNHLQTLRMETAKNLQRSELISTEANTLVKSVLDQTKDLQAKVALLESRQSEAQSQQLALEQLYQDLSKNRDEWALAEIEQVLSTASQQLQLAGNVQGALIALQNADRSLSRADKPQFINIRRAIAKDTEKLKALPTLDLAGVALRLDNVIAEIDTLPMLADEKPAAPLEPVRAGSPAKPGVAAKPSTLGERMRDTWRNWSAEMWGDIGQLIRVRSVDTPDALMMSPTQSYFLRENLKLRLLNARLALLSRNEEAFRTDLIAAQDALTKYFDVKARDTQTAQALLRQVQANNLAIEMPSLADSLNAVRNFKAKP